MLNPVNILKFIGQKNPKYDFNKISKRGMVLPLEGEGSFDEKGKQGIWVRYHDMSKENIIKTKFLYKDDNNIWRDSYNANGRLLTHFDNIKQEFTHYFVDSEKIKFIENYDTGDYIEYYENGNIKESGRDVKGKHWGVNKTYYENGNLETVSHYIDGSLYGSYKEFDENGELTISGEFKRNQENGLWKFYKNGKLSYEKEYQNGVLVVRPNSNLKFDLE